MNLSDFNRMPKEELKDYLRSESVDFLEDEATKEDLVHLARQHFTSKNGEQKQEEDAKEQDGTDEEKSVPAVTEAPAAPQKSMIVQEAEELVRVKNEIKAMGFESKEQMVSYLDGITRERKTLEFRQKEFDERERICAEREAKLEERAAYLDKKGQEVVVQVTELKEQTAKNQALVEQLSRLKQ